MINEKLDKIVVKSQENGENSAEMENSRFSLKFPGFSRFFFKIPPIFAGFLPHVTKNFLIIPGGFQGGWIC